jgi:hypothetical protein
MTIGLPVSALISATVNLTAQPAATPNFNTCLILGQSTVIDTVSRFRNYYSAAALLADGYLSTSAEYLAAVAWFGQSPQPTSLLVGRWAYAAASGQLICATATAANQVASGWTGVTAGSLRVSINGTIYNLSAMNFSAQTTMQGVAGVIQTALAAALAGTTCVWDSVYLRFVITSPTTGTGSTVSFLSSTGLGTDISVMMNGTATSSGAYVANGVAAETALAAVTLFDLNWSDQWYGLVIPQAVDTDHLAVAGYIESATAAHFYGVTHAEGAVLTSGDTTNISYKLKALGYNHTASQYSSGSTVAIVSLLARLLTTNFTGNNTAITVMYKQEPGVTAETLNQTQATNLASYNCNVFVAYNNATSIIQFGMCASGQFIDTVVGVDWMKTSIQTAIYNALYTSTTKIPQTDAGMHQLYTQIESICIEGVTNGLLAPGTWSGTAFGQLANGAWLSKGYYIYQPPMTAQTQAARAARQSVPFQIAAHLAGAVHTASLQLNVAA